MISTATTVISAERHERLLQLLRDLWNYRELFWTLTEREIKLRYKQTALGVIWVILQPLFLTGAFSLIFGRIAKMPTEGLPIVLFYFAATVPWNAFAAALSQSALSLEANAQLVTKVYFPRMVLPGAIILRTFLDFAIGWLLLVGIAVAMGHWHWHLLAVTPLLVLIQACTVMGLSSALTALNARYRDVKHTVHFVVQILMLATPVIYPLSRLPVLAQKLMILNPMAAVIETYRASLLGGPYDWVALGGSGLVALLYLVFGIWFFRKLEVRMADYL